MKPKPRRVRVTARERKRWSAARRRNNQTCDQVAEAAGMHRTSYMRLEQGATVTCNRGTYELIRAALGVA